MKKVLSLLLLFFLSGAIVTPTASGQRSSEPKSKKSFGQRIFFGGGLGFSLGTYSSMIDVSPIIGYAVTNEWMVGVGFTYKYYRYRDYYALIDGTGTIVDLYDFKTNMFGGSIWTRYFLTKTEIPVIENIFLHAEVEPLTFINQYTLDPAGEYRDIYNNRYIRQDDRYDVTGYFLGGGLRQMIGGNAFMYL